MTIAANDSNIGTTRVRSYAKCIVSGILFTREAKGRRFWMITSLRWTATPMPFVHLEADAYSSGLLHKRTALSLRVPDLPESLRLLVEQENNRVLEIITGPPASSVQTVSSDDGEDGLRKIGSPVYPDDIEVSASKQFELVRRVVADVAAFRISEIGALGQIQRIMDGHGRWGS